MTSELTTLFAVFCRYRLEVLGPANGASRVSWLCIPQPERHSFNIVVVSGGSDPDEALLGQLERPWSGVDLMIHAGGQVPLASAVLDAIVHLKSVASQP